MMDSKVSVNYQNNRSVKALEVPPDLTAPQYDRAFELPTGGTISAVAMQNGGMAPASFIPSASARSGDLATIKSRNGGTVLQINDSYQRALILTDIILKRMNFEMIRRDEARGVYRVEYNGQNIASGEKRGFFTRLLRRSSGMLLTKGKTYQVHLLNSGGVPLIQFRSGNGKELSPENHSKIIALLNDEFNR